MQIEDILETEQFKKLDLFLTEEMNEYAGKELVKKMLEVLDGEKSARGWFYTPLISLRGKRPYDYCKEGEILEVENLLGRIENGIFS